MKKSLVASVVIHTLVFVGITSGKLGGGGGTPGESNKPGGDQSQSDVGNIVEKPQDKTTEVTLVAKSDAPTAPAPKKKTVAKDCTGFGGVGIEYSSLDGSVSRVFSGYPAERVGVQVGDVLINISSGSLRGAVGTEVSFQILRNGQLYDVTLTRELICTDKVTGGK